MIGKGNKRVTWIFVRNAVFIYIYEKYGNAEIHHYHHHHRAAGDANEKEDSAKVRMIARTNL